jgi:peptidoglycan hydrolase-like protein with peptidoglycan-binding domain
VGGAAGAVLLVGTGAAATLLRAAKPAPAPGRPAPATATISRQTLVDVVTVNGTLGYGPAQPAESRLAGTVTALPPVGSTVERGEPLFRIDDTPVVLLYGGLPAYRPLTAGHPATPADPATGAAAQPAVPASRGRDVQQFEANLKALGYTGFTVDEEYSGATAKAVRRWQADLGLPGTGVVELGRVRYAPGPVRVAEHKLSAGSVATGPVLTYTGTTRLVTAQLPAEQVDLAKPRTKVTIDLASGTRVDGAVLTVGTPDAAAADQTQQPMVAAVLAPDDQAAVAGLDDGAVRVNFIARQRENVLVVPVGALLALAEGGYGLQIQDGPATRVVAVTTGLFADGKVEVAGPDLRAGMTVGMAQ